MSPTFSLRTSRRLTQVPISSQEAIYLSPGNNSKSLSQTIYSEGRGWRDKVRVIEYFGGDIPDIASTADFHRKLRIEWRDRAPDACVTYDEIYVRVSPACTTAFKKRVSRGIRKATKWVIKEGHHIYFWWDGHDIQVSPTSLIVCTQKELEKYNSVGKPDPTNNTLSSEFFQLHPISSIPNLCYLESAAEIEKSLFQGEAGTSLKIPDLTGKDDEILLRKIDDSGGHTAIDKVNDVVASVPLGSATVEVALQNLKFIAEHAFLRVVEDSYLEARLIFLKEVHDYVKHYGKVKTNTVII